MNVPSTNSETTTDNIPSHYDEFAFCFSFFKKFGPQLSLPTVTILALERFLSREYILPNDPITTIHHRLLSLVTRKPVTDDNWPYIISKMAYSARITNDIDSEYEEYNIKEKLLLLKFLCETQFDRNQSFKNQLGKIPDNDVIWRDDPIGVDKEGKRYWLLQDIDCDIRIYSEYKYLEYPFDHPQWNLICKSTDQILQLINKLSNSTHFNNDDCNDSSNVQDDDHKAITDNETKKSAQKRQLTVQQQQSIIGCMICGKDTLYSKMLLCDGCDKECHTFCQYPTLWVIPDNEWFCPYCRQLKLIEQLTRLHQELVQSKIIYQQSLENKRKKIKSLARGGMFVENIIQQEEELDVHQEDDAPRRSGRPRKRIDYAELNEVNIKLYSKRHDIITRSVQPSLIDDHVTRHSRNTRRNKVKDDDKTDTKHEEEGGGAICSRVQGYIRAYDHHQQKHTDNSHQSLVCSLPVDKIQPTVRQPLEDCLLPSDTSPSAQIAIPTTNPNTAAISFIKPVVSLVTPSNSVAVTVSQDSQNSDNVCYDDRHGNLIQSCNDFQEQPALKQLTVDNSNTENIFRD